MLGSHVVAEGILADKKQGNHQIEKNPLNTVLARIGGDVNDVRGHDRRDPDRGPLADQPEKSLGALELFPLVKAQENLQRMILVFGIVLKVLVKMFKSFFRNSFFHKLPPSDVFSGVMEFLLSILTVFFDSSIESFLKKHNFSPAIVQILQKLCYTLK